MPIRVPALLGGAAGIGLFLLGPSRLRAAYNGDVTRELERHPVIAPVTEADLEALPPL